MEVWVMGAEIEMETRQRSKVCAWEISHLLQPELHEADDGGCGAVVGVVVGVCGGGGVCDALPLLLQFLLPLLLVLLQ